MRVMWPPTSRSLPSTGTVQVQYNCKYKYKCSNQHWAVSICTVDGQRLSLGDVSTTFTLQSVSKAFTYGFCLQHLGHEHVHKFIGQIIITLHHINILLKGKNQAERASIQYVWTETV